MYLCSVFVNDMVARQLGRDRPLSPWSCETVEKLGGHVHILNKPEQLRGPLSPHRKDGTQNEEAGPYRQSVSARLSSSVMRPLGALDIQDSCFSHRLMGFAEALKSKVRKRAHLACCLCKSIGVEVHHIIPQEENGLDTEDNAAPLFPSCHETYGANPQKRKFISEARDLWYEICEKRFASDPERLDEIKRLLKNTVSYDDFLAFKEELLAHMNAELNTPRTEADIIREIDVLFDKVWYNRHLCLRERVEAGHKKVAQEIWKGALKAAKSVEKRYPKGELGPWTDFEWGMLNGKLSALRWVLGDDWDMLDT